MRVPGQLGTCFFAAVLLLALGRGTSADERHPANAEEFYRRARERFTQSTVASRIAALDDFATAVDLDPKRPDIWIAYGRACRESGQTAKARSCFERASELRPADAEVWSELGSEWKDDWLLTTDRASLDQALECFERATKLTPDRAGPWCASSALSLLRGHPKDALRAAMRARRADPTGAEPLLVLASSFYRLSVLVYSDSAFRMARERMPESLRQRFDDASFLDSGANASESSVREHFDPAPWKGTDPDLTTPENEALLEYRTRWTLAFFLFRSRDTLRWDRRADLFVRFGPPAAVQYNLARMGWGRELEVHFSPRQELLRPGQIDYLPGPLGYPINMQVWHYPDLGIRAVLTDRTLTHSYDYAPSLREEPIEARAMPELLANHSELMGVGAGRAVFRALAPGVRPMDVAGGVSRFVVGDSTRILAHVSAGGETADSMVGAWAITDPEGTVIERQKAVLAGSACNPTGERVFTMFAATVPNGDFRIELSVAARGGRRGVVRIQSRVDPVPAGLVMSDLVLVCGNPWVVSGKEAVRFEANLTRRVGTSDAVTAYFELDHLTSAPNGEARFEVRYTIRKAATTDRASPGQVLVESSREESSVGSHRRQFVAASIRSLPPGRYQLRVDVRDLIGGGAISKVTDFIKG